MTQCHVLGCWVQFWLCVGSGPGWVGARGGVLQVFVKPTPSLAQPLSLFSSLRLITKSSSYLQLSVSRQTQQQSKRFCELGGIFVRLRMASRGTPSVMQIYFFSPSYQLFLCLQHGQSHESVFLLFINFIKKP